MNVLPIDFVMFFVLVASVTTYIKEYRETADFDWAMTNIKKWDTRRWINHIATTANCIVLVFAIIYCVSIILPQELQASAKNWVVWAFPALFCSFYYAAIGHAYSAKKNK